MERNIIDELNIVKKWIDELSMLVNEGIQANNESQIERVKDILKQKRMRMIQRIESCKHDFSFEERNGKLGEIFRSTIADFRLCDKRGAFEKEIESYVNQWNQLVLGDENE